MAIKNSFLTFVLILTMFLLVGCAGKIIQSFSIWKKDSVPINTKLIRKLTQDVGAGMSSDDADSSYDRKFNLNRIDCADIAENKFRNEISQIAPEAVLLGGPHRASAAAFDNCLYRLGWTPGTPSDFSNEVEKAKKALKNETNRQNIVIAKPSKESNIAERVFENTWRSVVVIEDEEGQGSGVIIQPNIVATNCHVVESGSNIQVYKAENQRTNREVSYSATILKQDKANDFCLLSVNGLWGIPAVVRKYDTIKIGEDVYALGAPKGWDLSLSTGVVSQLRRDNNQRLIQTDTAVSPGSSGGGLFDSKGNLIGIMTKKIVDDDVEGIGFAIPADLVLDL